MSWRKFYISPRHDIRQTSRGITLMGPVGGHEFTYMFYLKNLDLSDSVFNWCDYFTTDCENPATVMAELTFLRDPELPKVTVASSLTRTDQQNFSITASWRIRSWVPGDNENFYVAYNDELPAANSTKESTIDDINPVRYKGRLPEVLHIHLTIIVKGCHKKIITISDDEEVSGKDVCTSS